MCAMIQAAKITFAEWKCRTFQSIIYPAEEKKPIGTSSILAWGKSRVGLPLPFIAINNRCKGVIPVGDRSAADLFVLVFGASRSGEVVIVSSVPFELQVRSLQGLVILEAELARRTACRAQVKQLKSEKLSPCSRGNRKDSNACASTTLSWPLSTSISWNAKDWHHVNSLTGEQRLLAKSTMRLSLHFKHRSFPLNFPLNFPRSCSSAKLIDR